MKTLRVMSLLAMLLCLSLPFFGCDSDDEMDSDGDQDLQTDGDNETPPVAPDTTVVTKLVPTKPVDGSICTDELKDENYCKNPGKAVPNIKAYTDQGFGVLNEEPGEDYTLHEDLGITRGTPTTRRSLFSWAQLTDVHITDEESPNRLAGYDTKLIDAALRPADMYTENVLNAVVKTINAFSAVDPLNLVLVTGDVTDSSQRNEITNYMKVLAGGEVNPDSGEKNDPVAGEGNDPQDVFVADGLKNLGWIQTLGNHDELILGNFPITQATKDQGVGDNAIGGTRNGQTYKVEKGTIVADANREPLTHQEMIDAILNGPGEPQGHGLTQTNKDENKGYYVYDPPEASLIRFMVLDTTFRPKGFEGQSYAYTPGVVDIDQFNDFIIPELDRALGEHKLVIVASHVPSFDLQDDHFPDRFVTVEELISTFQSYPNVLLHCVGHTHVNNVIGHKPSDKEGGYFEAVSTSLVDWPQQFRFFELVDNGNGTLSLFSTKVDFLAPEGSLPAQARKLVLIDVQSGWSKDGSATPADRNVEMVLEVPDGFEQFVSDAKGSEKVRALTTWSGK